ncbi:MAG TPA: glycosyltransferase [Polyangiaceae bacterium]|jgi:glycosyltransferase involved in cell wall biosynthesis|nr:glycosyltransferase [Polyangiaceae bacterium]
MPHVSVILPNYNYARYLRECVRSVLRQTHRNFEVLYVDDASTDDSHAVIETFRGDPKLTILEHRQNSGTVYRRWNEGAREAKGDWLWFPNADDAMTPRFLEVLTALGERDPRVALVHCRNLRIDGLGRLIGNGWDGQAELVARLEHDYVEQGHAEVVHLSGGCYLTSASSLIIRRDAFLAAGGFDERLWGCADYDLYLRLLHEHDIAYTTEPLAYYRIHGENTTKTTRHGVFFLSQAYCLAMVLARMNGDRRYTEAMRELVLRRCRSGVFDVFQEPSVTIPETMAFAAQAVHSVVHDDRLLRLVTPAGAAQ